MVYSQNRVVEAVYNKVVTGKNDWNQSKNTCWGLYVTEDQAKTSQIGVIHKEANHITLSIMM